jgi:hypothetical protein
LPVQGACLTMVGQGRFVSQVVVTVSQGKVVWEGGALNVKEGAGRFIRTPPFPPLFDGLAEQDAAWTATNFPYGPVPVQRDASHAADKNDEL